MHQIGGRTPGSGALETSVRSIHVEDGLLPDSRPDYFDPLAWDPLIMKFTEYFAGGTNVRESSLARGWRMPPLRQPVPA